MRLPLRRFFRLSFSVALLSLLLVPLSAQETLADWQKQRKEEFGRYKSSIDAEFGKFLKQRWKEFALFRGVDPYEEPKPKRLPALDKPDGKVQEDTPTVEIEPGNADFTSLEDAFSEKPLVFRAPPQDEERSDEKPDEPAPEPQVLKPIEVEFFGRKVNFEIDAGIQSLSMQGKINGKSIGRQWEAISSRNYEGLIEQFKTAKRELRLNDWGYGNLVQTSSSRFFPDDPQAAKLLTWFAMLKSGYDVRLGYTDNDLFLFASSRRPITNTAYIKVEGNRYYNTNFQGKNPPKTKFRSYAKDYPGNLKPLDLKFEEYPVMGKSEDVSKSLRFEHAGKNYRVDVEYDKNYIRFVNTFPGTSFDVFLASPMNPQAGTRLTEFVKQNVKGKSQVEAVNFVLAFVQKAFKYRTDREQFGFEKYFFPDENLFYDYSDCEDRVALFGYLAKNALNLDVVGLHYPNHLAAAVAFDGRVAGDAVKYEGKTYTVADPTYVNAGAGQAMPQFKNKLPKVIAF